MNIKWDLTVSALVFWLILSLGLSSDTPAFVEHMGYKHKCEQNPEKIHWISDKTSALVIGKSEDSVRICRLKFGLATDIADARVRLSFDFIYNHACGVYLQINQSTTSDFLSSTTNKEMFMSGCNINDPGPLFAQPKNFILISLVKENERLEAYNFRLNISMAEHLPSRGPELHIVIIVGFVLFTVVALSAILLYKYIANLSYHWHDQQVDEGMTRAINIYNSQEYLHQPDHTYVRPSGAQWAVKSHAAESIHSNGRVERFHTLDGPCPDNRDNRKPAVLNSQAGSSFNEPQKHHLKGEQELLMPFLQARLDLGPVTSPCVGADFGDSVSLGGCDIPPSYEEALGMPLATDVEKDMDEDGLDIAAGGRLEMDYFNDDSSEPAIGGGRDNKPQDGVSI